MLAPESRIALPGEVAAVSKEIYSNFVALATQAAFNELPFELGYSSGYANWRIGIKTTRTMLCVTKDIPYEDMPTTILDNKPSLAWLECEADRPSSRPLAIPRKGLFQIGQDGTKDADPGIVKLCESTKLATQILLKKLGVQSVRSLPEYIDGLLPHATAETYSGTARWMDPYPDGVSILADYSFCRGEYPEARRAFTIRSTDRDWEFGVVSCGVIGESSDDHKSYAARLPAAASFPENIFNFATLTVGRLHEIYDASVRSMAHGQEVIDNITKTLPTPEEGRTA